MSDSQNLNPVLNEKWLNRAAWLVNHREQLRLLLIGSIIFADAVLILFSGYWWADFLFINRARDQRMFQEISRPAQILALHGRLGPQPLSDPLALVLGGSRHDGKYDALVKFVNPNKNWIAKIKFKVIGDTESDSQELVLLNDEERFWVVPTITASASLVPQVVIEDVDWQSLRSTEEFNALKPRFVVSDVVYESIGSGSDSSPASRVKFNASNESTYDWWAVEFMVIVRQGSREMAAQNIVVDRFLTGQSREVSLNFYGPIGSGASAVVIPFVDISDPGAVIKKDSPSVGL
jgi:hypothetical protein